MPAMRDSASSSAASPESSTPDRASAVTQRITPRASWCRTARRVLRREQAQHGALERVAVLEARDAIVRERGAQQREELFADAGAACAHAAHVHRAAAHCSTDRGRPQPTLAASGSNSCSTSAKAHSSRRISDSSPRSSGESSGGSGAWSNETRRSMRSAFTS